MTKSKTPKNKKIIDRVRAHQAKKKSGGGKKKVDKKKAKKPAKGKKGKEDPKS